MRRSLVILSLSAGLGIAITAASPTGRALAQHAAYTYRYCANLPILKKYHRVSKQRQHDIAVWNHDHPEWVRKWKARHNLDLLWKTCYSLGPADPSDEGIVAIGSGRDAMAYSIRLDEPFPTGRALTPDGVEYESQPLTSPIGSEDYPSYDTPEKDYVSSLGGGSYGYFPGYYGGSLPGGSAGGPKPPPVTPPPVIPIAPTPEPSTLVLIGTGLIVFLKRRSF